MRWCGGVSDGRSLHRRARRTQAWELLPTGDIDSPSVDGNGDGLSCFHEAPKGSGIFTVVDNRSNGTGR